jgi:hypothetical protein
MNVLLDVAELSKRFPVGRAAGLSICRMCTRWTM